MRIWSGRQIELGIDGENPFYIENNENSPEISNKYTIGNLTNLHIYYLKILNLKEFHMMNLRLK